MCLLRDGKGVCYVADSTEQEKEFIKLISGVWKYNSETAGKTPAAFGIDIPRKALKLLSYQSDLVLDLFMGSGTTAVACVKLGWSFIGFEISKEYCRIVRERIKNWQSERTNGDIL